MLFLFISEYRFSTSRIYHLRLTRCHLCLSFHLGNFRQGLNPLFQDIRLVHHIILLFFMQSLMNSHFACSVNIISVLLYLFFKFWAFLALGTFAVLVKLFAFNSYFLAFSACWIFILSNLMSFICYGYCL